MKLLRQTIRNLILEGLKFNEMGNLALYEGIWAGDKHYVLFDIHLIDELGSEPEIPYTIGQNTDKLYGMLSVAEEGSWAPCNGAGQVNLARAKSGWGPTMYDIVMGLHPDGLIADRDSVSSQAFALWKFYKEQRTDIEKSPLDHENYEWTQDDRDDCYPGSDGDYLRRTNWDDGNPDHDHFLEDPLSWSYNRGPVPNMDQLRKNWDFFDTLAADRGLQLDQEFWIKLSRGFFSTGDD